MSETAYPLISICIPVYETEQYLEDCLLSCFAQRFDSFEIIVVSDASRGHDGNGRIAKRIVKTVQKRENANRRKNGLSIVPVHFSENHRNLGILETRRALINEASGEYIYQLDSDDMLTDDALEVLYDCAKQNDADFVMGDYQPCVFNEDGSCFIAKEKAFRLFEGTLEYPDIFPAWLLNKKFSGNNGGKLIKRDLFVHAFENISYTECNLAEDVLLFFFITQYAKKYIGISKEVYRYRLNVGMSSSRKIDNLCKWKLIASCSSVFTIIIEYIKAHSYSDDVIAAIRQQTFAYLSLSIKKLNCNVLPELQSEARLMLNEYWGKSFVEKVEKY